MGEVVTTWLFLAFLTFRGQKFHEVKSWTEISLMLQFGKFMLASSKENWLQGRKLIQRLMAFEERFF